MNFVFTGRISKIFDVRKGESADGREWKAVEFLVKEEGEDYPQSAVFKMFGVDKTNNFIKFNNEGDLVDVSFNFKANQGSSDNVFFNNLDAWKVFSVKDSDGDASADEPDDLPF